LGLISKEKTWEETYKSRTTKIHETDAMSQMHQHFLTFKKLQNTCLPVQSLMGFKIAGGGNSTNSLASLQ
jgi:hypothetical protein